MIHDLKTILIVVSATLAALFVHHALEKAEASAAGFGNPVVALENKLPGFE